MSKTKFEKIKEQQKKARNKEIIWRFQQILRQDNKEAVEILKDVVIDLHCCDRISPETINKHLKPWHKLIETTPSKEVEDEI